MPLPSTSTSTSPQTPAPTTAYQRTNSQMNQMNEFAQIPWFIKQAHSAKQKNPFSLNNIETEHFDLKMKLLRKHNWLWRLPMEEHDDKEQIHYTLQQTLNDISCFPLNLIENPNKNGDNDANKNKHKNIIESLCSKYEVNHYIFDKNNFVFYCPDIITRKKLLLSLLTTDKTIDEEQSSFEENIHTNLKTNGDNDNAHEPLQPALILNDIINKVGYKDNGKKEKNNFTTKIKNHPVNNATVIQRILNEVSLFIPSLSKPLTSEELLEKFLESNKIDSKLTELEPFYLIDLGDIIRQHIQWCELLPNVKPYYAIKCNPNPIIMQLLHLLGCGFDCASVPEFQILFENQLLPKYNFNDAHNQHNKDYTLYDNKLIYSNPCKDPLHLKYANANGIRLMTFDSEYELEKIKKYHPFAKVLIRIQADDSHSICQFNSKFGVRDNLIENLFEKCKKLELNLGGIMFHVGSGCMKASVYKDVIGKARYYMDIAQNKYGFDDCNVLDLGGGYPGVDNANLILFSDIAKQINEGLNEYFYNDLDFLSRNPKFQCIAEPGRYYVAKSHNLICNVIGKKKIINDNNTHHDGNGNHKETYSYTINDGIYGSFNCIIFDHQLPTFVPFKNNNPKLYSSVVFGPTCDSMDRLLENVNLPELNIGNKVIVPNFGAYTNAAATTFNGFPKSRLFYALTTN